MPYKMQPADVQAKFEEYRRQCDEHIEAVRYRDKLVQAPRKIIYTLEGFCLFAGIGEDDLEKYRKNKNYAVVFKNIRYAVLCRKIDALVNGEGNTRGLIFDLKVNHGIDPKQAREETDWQITLNLNHDNVQSLETLKSASPEGGKAESPEDGNLRHGEKVGNPQSHKPADPAIEKVKGAEEGKPAGLDDGKEGRKDIVPAAQEIEKPEIARPPTTPGIRPGLVPTGGLLPHGGPRKVDYEPEYKPEGYGRYSVW